MKPKISVITICYNAVDLIEKTILSVLHQSYDNIEYIIIDGNSTDGTVDIIQKYANQLAYWISEPDGGIFDAMNKGLDHATGEWVNFMNAGDWFYSDDVVAQISTNMSKEHTIIYGNTLYRREKGDAIEQACEPAYIKRNMPTCHQSFFVRTQLAKEIGFDIHYRYAADYNMMYLIYKRYGLEGIQHRDITVSAYEAFEGLSMVHANEVYRETLHIRDNSLHKFCGYVRYFIKKIIGRK
jgi:glycosyltransferase involved in cell wall biosynthesis